MKRESLSISSKFAALFVCKAKVDCNNALSTVCNSVISLGIIFFLRIRSYAVSRKKKQKNIYKFQH